MNSSEFYSLEKLSVVLRKKWSICALTNLFLDADHFQELMEQLPNVSPKVLNETLKELEEYGLIKKETLNNQTRYKLTDKGLESKEFITQYYIFLLKMTKTEQEEELLKNVIKKLKGE